MLLTNKGPQFEFICVTMPGLEPPDISSYQCLLDTILLVTCVRFWWYIKESRDSKWPACKAQGTRASCQESSYIKKGCSISFVSCTYDEPLAIGLDTWVAITHSLFIKLDLKVCRPKGFRIRNRIGAFCIFCLDGNFTLVQEHVTEFIVILVLWFVYTPRCT